MARQVIYFGAGRVGRPGRVSVPPPRTVPQPVFNRHQIDLRPVPQNNSQADPRGSPQHGHHAYRHLSGIPAWQSVLLTELRHGEPPHRYSSAISAWRDGHLPVLRHGHLAHRCFSGIPANRDDWKVKTMRATKAEATIASGVWGVGSIWH